MSMRGIFIGRFQPLHKGHVSIIEAALEDVDELVIGIGSAECSYTSRDPFTAGERMEMLLALVKERNWQDRTVIIPIRDVNRFSIWVSHVASLCPGIDVVFSNNPLTIRLFQEAGYEVRSTKLVDRDNYAGIRIRERIRDGESWEELVPGPVRVMLEDIGGVRRIKDLMTQGEAP